MVVYWTLIRVYVLIYRDRDDVLALYVVESWN